MLGRFTFVLHSHLPYVLHHGKWPFGSDWLGEAVAECYIPILRVLDSLTGKNIRARISMDFSPILLEQLADPDFPKIFSAYCNEKITLAEADIKLFSKNNEDEYIPLAQFWKKFYETALRDFKKKYTSNLIAAFRRHSDSGTLDAMTCAATHGYLPLLLDDRNVRAQLRTAIRTHETYFGKKPRGVWLPECAYRPRYHWTPPVDSAEYEKYNVERSGIEEILAGLGLEYFVVEGALTKGGIPIPTYPEFDRTIHEKLIREHLSSQYFINQQEHQDRSLSEIYRVQSTLQPIAGTAPVVFSRDRHTSEQVWSGEFGYPGDPRYLEFHKKHHNSGLRYWRVTSSATDLADKQFYDPASTAERIDSHSTHFISLIKQTLIDHRVKTGTDGVVCSPFDTELFGHWWFEGPQFIESVLQKLSLDPDVLLSNCAETLDERTRPYQVIALPEGSWGEGGGHFVWLNNEVRWMWDEIYSLESKFLQTLDLYRSQKKQSKAATNMLRQAARELLLVESSDWEFLITTESAAEYAKKRFTKHCKRLKKLLVSTGHLLKNSKQSNTDKKYLEKVSSEDSVFAHIELSDW